VDDGPLKFGDKILICAVVLVPSQGLQQCDTYVQRNLSGIRTYAFHRPRLATRPCDQLFDDHTLEVAPSSPL